MKIKILSLIAVLSTAIVNSKCSKAIIDETPPNVITEEIRYNDEVKNIMLSYCTTCHASITPSAGLDLTQYESVRFSTENGALIQRINSQTNPMPQSGLMPEIDRLKIQKWADDGYPR